MVMDGDVAEVEAGGKGDFHYAESPDTLYPPAKVGPCSTRWGRSATRNTKLIARKTPGHTKGCTTWTFKVEDGGKRTTWL